MRAIEREELEKYFGDDDWEQLVEYILNLLNRNHNIDDCYAEVIEYLEE